MYIFREIDIDIDMQKVIGMVFIDMHTDTHIDGDVDAYLFTTI